MVVSLILATGVECVTHKPATAAAVATKLAVIVCVVVFMIVLRG